MEGWWSDLRHALRQLAARPGYTLLSIAVLAGGLGGTLFMLTAINSMIIEPVPFKDAETLVHLGQVSAEDPDEVQGISHRDFLAWRERQQALVAFEGYTGATINLSDAQGPTRFDGAFVTGGLFELIGARAVLGRALAPADDRAGAPLAVVLSDAVWRDRFGADPAIIGRAIRANGRDATVVGVMAPGFGFPFREQVWMPARLDERTTPDQELYLQPIGRLKPGTTIGQATAAFEAMDQALDRELPAAARAPTIGVEPVGHEFSSKESRRVVGLMFATSLLVLLVACANVANLQLAQIASRRRELAVRAALGAGRARLMALVMLESLLISFAATAIGLAIAAWCGRAVLAMLIANDDAPAYWINFDIDGVMVLFALAAALLTSLAAGLVPALRASGTRLSESMRDGDKGGVGGGFARFSRGLVVAEIALTFVLLVGAGISVRIMESLMRMDLGTRADPAQVLTGRIALFPEQFPTPEAQMAFFDHVLEKLRAEPGVEAATAGSVLPGFLAGGDELAIEGTPDEAPGIPVYSGRVDEAFADTYGLVLKAGRWFERRDDATAPPVAVVDEVFAARAWPNQDPLGRRVRGDRTNPDSPWLTVVGVVAPVHLEDVDDGRRPTVFAPLRQEPQRFVSVAVRLAGDAAAFGPRLAEIVREVDADTPVYWVRTQERAVAIGRSGPDLMAKIFGSFGVLGLVLAAAGLYGVLAFAVEQRTREIGLRRAIGATEGGVLRAIVGRSAWQVGIGLVIGAALGVPWAMLMGADLPGQEAPNAAPIFPLVLLVIVGVAALAALIPARRALRVDPMVALRYE